MALTTDQHIPLSRASTTQKTRKKQRWTRYSSRTFYLFISPWLLGFFGLTVFPLGYSLLVSFTNWDGISDKWHWIGLANYAELFRDPITWLALQRTLIFTLLIVPLLVIIGLGLALLLHRPWRGIGIFRSIFFLPSIVPVVAAAVAWRFIFDRDAGILNAVIERLGGPAITWLIDPAAFGALVMMVIWGVGGGMVISLAGLQGIPAELLEAARIDGAGAWRTFRAVTFPLLSPVLFFQLVTNVIFALQTFIQPLLLVGGGLAAGASAAAVPKSIYLYMIHVYLQFLFNQRFGYGSALLWIFFLIILLITLVIFRFSKFWVYYEVDQEGK